MNPRRDVVALEMRPPSFIAPFSMFLPLPLHHLFASWSIPFPQADKLGASADEPAFVLPIPIPDIHLSPLRLLNSDSCLIGGLIVFASLADDVHIRAWTSHIFELLNACIGRL